MRTEHVVWEINALIAQKTELQLVGHDLDYMDQKRLEKLRDFLDEQNDSNTEESTDGKEESSDEVPF